MSGKVIALSPKRSASAFLELRCNFQRAILMRSRMKLCTPFRTVDPLSDSYS